MAFDKLINSPVLVFKLPRSSLESQARIILKLKPPHPEHILAWEMAESQGIAASVFQDAAAAVQGYK